DQLVELDEAARVAQQVDALARGQLAGVVLARHAFRPAGGGRLLFQRRERREPYRPAVALFRRLHPGSPNRPCTYRRIASRASLGGSTNATSSSSASPSATIARNAHAPPSGSAKRTSTGRPVS